ncbi:MAG: CoA pyrophosphatase [Robiginitomaculum sp.]|nr:MAG: CoA pyrophosphatase [Robiginitomaculum sp.]
MGSFSHWDPWERTSLNKDIPAGLLDKLDPVTGPDNGQMYSDFDLNSAEKASQTRANARAAAVLVPLIQRPQGWQVLLTLRTNEMPTHAGQISFPGGGQRGEDLGLDQTALREFEEETGVPQSQVQLLGKFDRYRTVTNYQITPFVGVVSGQINLQPDPREVAEAFEVPFSFLGDLANFKRESRIWQGRERFFYSIPWQDRYIWGATAGMLRALALRLVAQNTGTNP